MKNFTITFLATIFTLSIYAQDRLEHVDYGQGKSIGFSLLGNSMIAGATYKIERNQDQIELSAGFASTTDDISFDNSDFSSNPGFAFVGGYNFFLGSKNKERKHKVIKNYLSAKLGATFTNVNILSPTLTWRREAFREEEQNYSRGFDLGLSYNNILGNGFVRQGNDLVTTYANVFIRFDWNWFRA